MMMDVEMGQHRDREEAAVGSVEKHGEDRAGRRRWAEAQDSRARLGVLGQCRAGVLRAELRRRALEGWVVQDGYGESPAGGGGAACAECCCCMRLSYGSCLPTENGVWGQRHCV